MIVLQHVDKKNTKNGEEICRHDYRQANSTLIGVPKFKMVVPSKYNLQCEVCGEVFTVSQDNIEDIKLFLHTFF